MVLNEVFSVKLVLLTISEKALTWLLCWSQILIRVGGITYCKIELGS